MPAMNLTVTLEQRFSVTQDGRAWLNGPAKYSFWQLFLEVFDDVRVVGRGQPVDSPPAGEEEVTGDRVSFFAMPYYVGPEGYIRARSRIKKAAVEVASWDGALISRSPSPLGATVCRAFAPRPYGVSVVGDPMQSISSFDHWAKRILSRLAARQLRQQCLNASVIEYVTERVLQEGYPGGAGSIMIGCSDVQLPPEAFVPAPRTHDSNRPARIVCVGSLDAPYKGQTFLLQAGAGLIRDGLVESITLVGEGRFQSRLESEAANLGISSQVKFAGFKGTPALVWETLDEADLFVLPSLQEGLPRAVVEAMARGLPCVCTSIGGMVELLHESNMVAPRDTNGLEQRLRWILLNPWRDG